MSAISAQGLGKRYRLRKRAKGASALERVVDILGLSSGEADAGQNDLWALKDVDLQVSHGEVLGIIGPNGAGKSTLLKILAHVTPPTTGSARMRGQVVSLLELGTGFQPDLTARENVYLSAAFYGIPRQEVDRYFDELIQFAELEKFVDSPVKHFSSGMYIRLAFSNAIHMRPDILLADEVLAVGDIGFQRKCMDRMQEIGSQGVAVLLVSHDMAAIRRLCQRCIHLDAGRLVDEGDVEAVVQRYEQRQLHHPRSGVAASAVAATSQSTSPYASIRSVQLMSTDRQEVGAWRAAADHYLVMNFDCSLPHTKVLGGFDVLAGDVLVFRTNPAQVDELAEPGMYQYSARIPGGLLAEKDYNVTAGLRVICPDGREFHLKAVRSLVLRSYDTAREDVVSGLPLRRVGLVAPKLEWSMGKL